MSDTISAIRETAKKLLEEGKVDLIIGFENGTLPSRSSPCFIRKPADVEKLVWNSNCENNLAKYLPGRKEKVVGIIANGCGSRAIVGLIQEKQVDREKLVILGVPCEGMTDRNSGLLDETCKTCQHPNPVIYDFLIGDKVKENENSDPYAAVKEFGKKGTEERWEYITGELSRCIRCYACRNSCPFCYCRECFVDSTKPQWIGKTVNETDTQFFHMVRALHLAGRCVSCGACERACPMGIDLRVLNKKLEEEV
ncbi:MAG: 4Fe-4S dicluster domain-containing protein, partial [Dehalococcoidales bacterium]|nr:4Fe-4S dicluster domain-containing protein [Dehalococcoidales bacterium]